MIWIIFLAMTAAAVMAVLWPLSRHRSDPGQADPDTQFYREQIAEIERDRERGALLPSEAEAAKAEAGRRLLRANQAPAARSMPWASRPFAAAGRRRPWPFRSFRSWRLRSMALYGSPHICRATGAARGNQAPQADHRGPPSRGSRRISPRIRRMAAAGR